MKWTRIASLSARRVWDALGHPTLEAEIVLEGGVIGRGIAPAAGADFPEAVPLHDGGEAFGGLDVTRAVKAVDGDICRALRGRDVRDQIAIDDCLLTLDGTPGSARLGANALVAVSMAAAHARAAAEGLPLWRSLAGERPARMPVPQVSLLSCTPQAGSPGIAEILVVPVGAQRFSAALDMAAEIHRAAGALAEADGRLSGLAERGGWQVAAGSGEGVVALAAEAITRAGFTAGSDAALILRLADGTAKGSNRPRSDGAPGAWLKRYPVVSVDPIATAGTRGSGSLVVTLGQLATLSEMRQALKGGRDAGRPTVLAGCTGDSEDVTLAHLAVGWGAAHLRAGGFARGERTAKWNEALRIADALGEASLAPPATFTWSSRS